MIKKLSLVRVKFHIVIKGTDGKATY